MRVRIKNINAHMIIFIFIETYGTIKPCSCYSISLVELLVLSSNVKLLLSNGGRSHTTYYAIKHIKELM